MKRKIVELVCLKDDTAKLKTHREKFDQIMRYARKKYHLPRVFYCVNSDIYYICA